MPHYLLTDTSFRAWSEYPELKMYHNKPVPITPHKRNLRVLEPAVQKVSVKVAFLVLCEHPFSASQYKSFPYEAIICLHQIKQISDCRLGRWSGGEPHRENLSCYLTF